MNGGEGGTHSHWPATVRFSVIGSNMTWAELFSFNTREVLSASETVSRFLYIVSLIGESTFLSYIVTKDTPAGDALITAWTLDERDALYPRIRSFFGKRKISGKWS